MCVCVCERERERERDCIYGTHGLGLWSVTFVSVFIQTCSYVMACYVSLISLSLVPMKKCLVVFIVIVTKVFLIFVGIFSNHLYNPFSCGYMGDHVASVLNRPAKWCKSTIALQKARLQHLQMWGFALLLLDKDFDGLSSTGYWLAFMVLTILAWI